MRLLPLVLFVAAAGCYQIDADVSGLTASGGQTQFDASGLPPGQLVTIDRMITFNASSSLAALVRAARIDTVTLTPAGGVGSLDFLQSLTLTLHAPAGDVPLVEASGNMTQPDGSVRLSIERDIDPALLQGPIMVDAALELAAPTGAWAMGVTASLTVRGHADVEP